MRDVVLGLASHGPRALCLSAPGLWRCLGLLPQTAPIAASCQGKGRKEETWKDGWIVCSPGNFYDFIFLIAIYHTNIYLSKPNIANFYLSLGLAFLELAGSLILPPGFRLILYKIWPLDFLLCGAVFPYMPTTHSGGLARITTSVFCLSLVQNGVRNQNEVVCADPRCITSSERSCSWGKMLLSGVRG